MPDELAEAEAMSDVSLTFVNGFLDTRIIIDHVVAAITDATDRSIFDLVAVLHL